MSVVKRPIIQIFDFPVPMIPLRERIEESGYVFAEEGSIEGGLAPALAFVPLSMQVPLDELKSRLQAALAANPALKIIGVSFGRLRFKAGEAYGAGVHFLYALPFEEELLFNKLFELLPPDVATGNLTIDQLMRVNIVEIEKAPSLPFNLYLYLPMNRKVILYYERDNVIDERRVKKFKENAHYNIYIYRGEIQAYKKYCADLIAGSLSGGAGVVEGEKRRKSAEWLMGLMGGFFTDEAISEVEGQMVLDNLKSVVDELESPGASKEVSEQVDRLVSQRMSHISHAQNVAAYCCLFGLALNAGDPTTLKLGGLLHDLGLADLPMHLIGRDLEELDETDAAKYKLHPGNGKLSIEEKKLRLPPQVMEMVLYHHERPDGSGYPYGKKGAEIPLLAKICAFADEFDKLTSVRVGKRQLSPVEAVRKIAGLDGEKPHALYEESIHRPLVDMLLKPRTSTGPAGASAASPTGSVKVAEATARKPGASGIAIKALLERPKYAKKFSAGLRPDAPEYATLAKELDTHWAKRKAAYP